MPEINDPKQLFVHKLGAALTMEQTVLEMLKELEGAAVDDMLRQQFSHHRSETEEQIANLEQAFSELGEAPKPQPCPAIEGLQREGKEMQQKVSIDLLDSVLLAGAAETEHHEIAVYDTLITHAAALGEGAVVSLLEDNLEQEEHTLAEVEQAAKKQASELESKATT